MNRLFQKLDQGFQFRLALHLPVQQQTLLKPRGVLGGDIATRLGLFDQIGDHHFGKEIAPLTTNGFQRVVDFKQQLSLTPVNDAVVPDTRAQIEHLLRRDSAAVENRLDGIRNMLVSECHGADSPLTVARTLAPTTLYGELRCFRSFLPVPHIRVCAAFCK